ncbi:hypothetical protein PG994_008580 [Apiospora phragmitis]|uniref:Uncharacterized protein n=1 Tax=Apiospora phragmitis TaxID=2905665 RepID=A0ABR1UHF1_9PEZI
MPLYTRRFARKVFLSEMVTSWGQRLEVPQSSAISFVAFFVGCAPLLPGFIAAVNPDITVPAGATHLYDLSFIYGFAASGSVYSLLHVVFPARALDAFVKDSMTARQTMNHYREKWDAVDGSGIDEGVVFQAVDSPVGPRKS